MIVLALDTCLAACSAAVVWDGELLSSRCEPMTRGHQERLAGLVREVMSEAERSFSDLDLIGVTVGPGSFTGLRVGLAFAKGLALALDRPCVGVGTLESLSASLSGGEARAAVIDSGRGRVYLQMFEGQVALGAPDVLDLGVAAARLIEVFPHGEVTLTGPGAGLLEGALSAARLVRMESPDPFAVARLAALAARVAPRPLYLRPPDAKVKAA